MFVLFPIQNQQQVRSSQLIKSFIKLRRSPFIRIMTRRAFVWNNCLLMLLCPISNPPLNMAYIYIFHEWQERSIHKSVLIVRLENTHCAYISLKNKHYLAYIWNPVLSILAVVASRHMNSHYPQKKTHTQHKKKSIYISPFRGATIKARATSPHHRRCRRRHITSFKHMLYV